MANTFITTQLVAKTSLSELRNTLVLVKLVKSAQEASFGNKDMQIGDSIRVKIPVRTTSVRNDVNFVAQNFKQKYVDLDVQQRLAQYIGFSSLQRALQLGDFKSDVTDPVMNQLGNDLETDFHDTFYKMIPNTVGDFLTNANTMEVYLKAKSILDNNGVPADNRYVINDSNTNALLSFSQRTLFNPAQEVSKYFRDGVVMGTASGLTFMWSQCVARHTVGTGGNDPIIVNGNQDNLVTNSENGFTTLTISGLTNVLNAGDVLEINSVEEVNELTRKTTGRLKQFVVKETTAPGATSVKIFPSIISQSSGDVQQQNVFFTAGPIGGKSISVLGNPGDSGYENLVFHRDFATKAFIELPLFPDYKAYTASDSQTGTSVRVTDFYNGGSDTGNTRWDIQYGRTVQHPLWAVRVRSKGSYA